MDGDVDVNLGEGLGRCKRPDWCPFFGVGNLPQEVEK